MKIIDNLIDIKRLLEVKDLLEPESIKVDIISLKSAFLGVDSQTYIFVRNCYICDKNYNLPCNLDDDCQVKLYKNFNKDSEDFKKFIEAEIGCNDIKYLKFIEFNNIRDFNKTYRVQEK